MPGAVKFMHVARRRAHIEGLMRVPERIRCAFIAGMVFGFLLAMVLK